MVGSARTRAASAFALLILAATAAAAFPGKVSLEVGSGYRVDSLSFNIAADPTGASTPNVLSELTWRDLKIFQTQATVRAETEYGLYGKAMVGYGWIVAGSNQDSDYNGDDRTLEYSRSNNDAGFGHVLDGSLALGYDWRVGEGDVSLIPLLGLSYAEQRLSMRNGFQTLSAPPQNLPPGPFNGLDSSYDARWLGPWLGADAEWRRGRLTLGASGEYHFAAAYSATANWNLRDDFQHPDSFDHSATAEGVVAAASLAWKVDDRWSVRAEGRWQDWSTGHGTDFTNFANGGAGATRLNRVTWTSTSATLSAAYRFGGVR
jgi:hypothetical protein